MKMMSEKFIVPGISYGVSVKNTENTPYKKTVCVRITLKENNKAVVEDLTCRKFRSGESPVLFTGTPEECMEFINLVFNYTEPNAYDFKHKLPELVQKSNHSDDPVMAEIHYFLRALMQNNSLEPMDCDYELEGILKTFLVDTKEGYLANPEEFLLSEKAEELYIKYRNLIKAQVKAKFGSVYPIEDFLQAVENGCINDDDGGGNLMDENGDEGPSVWDVIYFDDEEDKYQIEMPKDKNYPYVVWYNK